MALRLFNLSISNIICNVRATSRFMSTKDIIVLSDDGTTFVAWHPKKDFPYECTRPIPNNIKEESNTVLKTVMSPELKEIFKKKSADVARQELMSITHTTKHRWFPRARDKKAKKTESDREYL